MATPAYQGDTAAHCRALVVGYHRDIDSGRATDGIGAFSDDAEFEAHGKVLRGRGEILDFLRTREANTGRQTVHVLANEVVTAHRVGHLDEQVELQAMILLHLRQPDGAYVLERVLNTVHRFRRSEGEWRITARASKPLHPTV
jgi:hypothetical protein